MSSKLAMHTRRSPSQRKSRIKGVGPRLSFASACLISFTQLLAFTGGSSHADEPQLIVLRALAALFLIPVFYLFRKELVGEARPLLLMGCILAGWMIIQLIPLPPFLWQLLPDRESIAQIDAQVGIADVWRPISWVPARTLNALASLVVPFAALLLAVTLRVPNFALFNAILGLALFDAGMNFLQVVSGGDTIFFLYDPKPGQTDGLFANENHSGLFSAIGMLVATRLATWPGDRRAPQAWRLLYGLAFLMLLLAALIGGSRAGLAAAFGAAAC